jgi:HD-like signal output (HDOD) protein
MKVPVADEAFLAGMIHDVGMLVSLQLQPEKLREVCERVKTTGQPFVEVERELLGTDHQQLGAALAEQWKFPRSCQMVAGFHHRPALEGEQNRLLVTLVYAADTVCCQSSHGFNLTALHQKLDAAALADVKLDPVLVERTAGKLGELVTVASSLLG